jgi:hypothetical protein
MRSSRIWTRAMLCARSWGCLWRCDVRRRRAGGWRSAAGTSSRRIAQQQRTRGRGFVVARRLVGGTAAAARRATKAHASAAPSRRLRFALAVRRLGTLIVDGSCLWRSRATPLARGRTAAATCAPTNAIGGTARAAKRPVAPPSPAATPAARSATTRRRWCAPPAPWSQKRAARGVT